MALIWTPGDPLDLITVEVGATASDQEIRGMLAINQAARNFVDGIIDPIEYLDKLEHFGIVEPLEFLNEFVEHIEFVT